MNDYARRRIMNDRSYEQPRDMRHEQDYMDYYSGNHDYRRASRQDMTYGYDGHAPEVELTKHDIMKWKRHLMNADGSEGEHFNFEEIMDVAEKMRLKFRGYSEKDLCMTVNMLYSDYCKVLKQIIPPDKELYIYVALAEAFLNDEDGPDGSEKLALYYHCIVKDNG